MNKLYVVFALALALVSVNNKVFADDDVASSTPVVQVSLVSPGGYSQVCSYVLVYAKCDPKNYSQIKFALNDTYRESILIPWRKVIFHGKYNHQ